MRKSLYILIIFILFTCFGAVLAEEDASATEPVLHNIDKSKSAIVYDSGFEVDGFEFYYTIKGSIINCKLIAPATGWVRLGLRPYNNDAKYNIILGWVTPTQYLLADCFISPKYSGVMLDKKLGGTDDITDTAGYEENGKTILFFSLPLQAKDEFDTVIGGNMILFILECADSDDLNEPPKVQTSFITAVNPGEDTFDKFHQ